PHRHGPSRESGARAAREMRKAVRAPRRPPRAPAPAWPRRQTRELASVETFDASDPPQETTPRYSSHVESPAYRISTTRSPASREATTCGHERSNSRKRTVVRQFPERTHINLPFAPG